VLVFNGKLHIVSYCVLSVRYHNMNNESGSNLVSRTVMKSYYDSSQINCCTSIILYYITYCIILVYVNLLSSDMKL